MSRSGQKGWGLGLRGSLKATRVCRTFSKGTLGVGQFCGRGCDEAAEAAAHRETHTRTWTHIHPLPLFASQEVTQDPTQADPHGQPHPINSRALSSSGNSHLNHVHPLVTHATSIQDGGNKDTGGGGGAAAAAATPSVAGPPRVAPAAAATTSSAAAAAAVPAAPLPVAPAPAQSASQRPGVREQPNSGGAAGGGPQSGAHTARTAATATTAAAAAVGGGNEDAGVCVCVRLFMCMCACVCVRVCVRACVHPLAAWLLNPLCAALAAPCYIPQRTCSPFSCTNAHPPPHLAGSLGRMPAALLRLAAHRPSLWQKLWAVAGPALAVLVGPLPPMLVAAMVGVGTAHGWRTGGVAEWRWRCNWSGKRPAPV